VRLHALKTWPEFFRAIWDGEKTFEARRDDRGYAVGDELLMREWVPKRDMTGVAWRGDYTGRSVRAVVTYVLRGGSFGVEPGHVVMALRVLDSIGARNTADAVGDHVAAPAGEAVAS
jgi:hypothetical protein